MNINKKKNLISILEKELGEPTFGGFIQGARASKELSQSDMAKKLGITRSTLCDIEKGRHLVSPSLASKIAIACGLSEIVAVRTALQDQLNKSDLNMKVAITK